ncbi:hypothetical protein CPT_Mater114 [Bacillus phage Mater]|uniref:Acb2/Tad1 hairpin domain-containing protein n=1 Tax=Bacillus phage Mater TaxID=1540090 RepID=A0A0A0RS07_9CAUD|nr:hypothetical protein CPT_Mater114 [Bacillus phage Mater]AIW03271.1 hypothetical protein CPT_Mater114 [Bacillus phage Mater]
MGLVEKVNHPLLSEKYTRVYRSADSESSAIHDFYVVSTEVEEGKEHTLGKTLADIHFQEGPIKEAGINGVMNEDLLVMILVRLQAFQETEFKCKENAMAITKIEEALLWLRARTMGREQKGIEGTHKI